MGFLGDRFLPDPALLPDGRDPLGLPALEDTPSEREELHSHDSAFSAYLDALRKTPLLSAGEERALIQRIRAGDARARDHLLRANLRLVVHVARKFMSRGLELEDLVEEGNLGLMHALEKFDPDKGFRFSTYATWWIRQAVARGLMSSGRLIRLPEHVGQQVQAYLRAANKAAPLGPLRERDREIAQALGKNVAEIQDLAILASWPLSVDVPLAEEPDQSWRDFLVDEEAGEIPDKIHAAGVETTLRQALAGLPNPERTVVLGRFGLFGSEPQTVAVLATQLGVSRGRIKQLEEAGLIQLKQGLEARGLSAETLF